MTTWPPLISVAIPAFNAQATIRETIESVLTQSHRSVEIVVCNDASTDETSKVISGIGDDRIRLLHNETNLGEGLTRDKAMAIARGDWIAVLDADDTWHPKRLETLLGAVSGNGRNVMIFDDLLICHQTDTGMRPWRPLRGRGAFGSRHGSPVDVSRIAWARAERFLIKPLIPAAYFRSLHVRHTARRFGEDTEFILRLIAAGMKLRYVPQALYNYRITPGSMSAITPRARLMRDMLEEVLPLFAGDAEMQAALQRKIDYRDFTMAIKSGDVAAAAKLACRQPSLATELVSRAAGEVPYHLSRMWHRAGRQRPQGNPHA